MTARKTTRRAAPTVGPDRTEKPEDAPTPVVTRAVVTAGDGRPKCVVELCELPEVIDNVGLCGGHYATRPDLRKGARRG